MVLELVAGRVISRHLGSSLYTWTSVIGVVLAGIALGNAIGGRLADRTSPLPALSRLFLLASVCSIIVLFANAFVGEWVFLWTLPWPVRIVLHVSLVFLAPSVVLGMIGPFASKMAAESGAQMGRALGNVSAWGVIGSILGTFSAGYFLVAAFGTTAVVWGVAGTLALAGLALGAKARAAWVWAGMLGALATVGAGPTGAMRTLAEDIGLREKTSADDVYVDESQYSHIRIAQESEHPGRLYMHLDKLVHSTTMKGNPLELHYGYERIYANVTRLLLGGRTDPRTLTIGGGGYTFPKFLETVYPESYNVVVEIDPAVTRAAIAAFELPANHKMTILHEDGRVYLQRLAQKKKLGEPAETFDFVYLDVFNDYSVPYQLTTIEAIRIVNDALTPGGAFLMNMIDTYQDGRFLGTMLATLAATFPEVYAFSEGRPAPDQPSVRNTFILVGSKKSFDPAPVIQSYDPAIGLSLLDEAAMQDLMQRSGHRVLTDDWAPIENFLAPVVRSASREIAASALTDRAEDALQSKKVKKALSISQQAIALHPIDINAHRVRGQALLAEGRSEEAIGEFQEMLRIRPSLLGPRVQMATTYAKLNRIPEALDTIAEAVRRDPKSSQAHFVAGVLLQQAKRFEEAAAAYARAVELDPKNLEARNGLGIALVESGKPEEARRAFEEALAVDPKFTKASKNLQRLLGTSG